MSRAYTLVAYAAFVLTTAWGVAFLADMKGVPRVDGPTGTATLPALAIDLALLGGFAVQHTLMAREGVKRWMRGAVPPAVERSTYVLAASLCLALAFSQWRALPTDVWRVGYPAGRGLIWLVYAVGWALALASTFLVDHLSFLGLRGADDGPLEERSLYRWVRHPMMLGLVIAFWATPTMSAGHLLFAAASTAYVLVGIRFEERDLRRRFGAAYAEYAERVPPLLPWPRPTGRLEARTDAR